MDNLNLKYIEGFGVQLVGFNTWAIDDYGIALMYLVVGEERAVLIDTGMGMGNLQAVVKQLTDLPVSVINTHGHGDHIGGNDEFSGYPIYLHEADHSLLAAFLQADHSESFRKSFQTEGFYGHAYYDMERKFSETKIELLYEGMIFDLGNRTLEVIEVPGHTKGSVVLLDRENGYLFSGDAVVSTPTLIVSEMGSTNLNTYKDGLIKLKSYKEWIQLIFPGHYLKPIEPSYIDSLIRVCEMILEQNCDYEDFDLRFITERRTVKSAYKKASIVYVKEDPEENSDLN